jgi:hypothetical protein
MKWTGTILLALALTITGCVELPIRPDVKPPPSANGSATLVPMAPPPVRPDQVNDGDARPALDALRGELDRAANEPAQVQAPVRNSHP